MMRPSSLATLLLSLTLTAAPAHAQEQAAAPQSGDAQAVAQPTQPQSNDAHPKAPAQHPATKKTAPADDSAGATHLPAGRFGTVAVYEPKGPPQSVAIFLSGDGGWHLGVINMARSLQQAGAVVIGVDVTHYLHSLGEAAASGKATCQSIAGDFENLSHRIQKKIGATEYHVPVLVGYSSGATVVYAVLVQSPPGTFAGAMSLGFCPDQDFAGASLCPGAGLHYSAGKKNDLIFEPARTLKQPWIALQGQQDQVCAPRTVDEFGAQVPGAQVVQLPKVGHGFGVERNWLPQFMEAYHSIVERVNAPKKLRPQPISDLPVNEVHAEGSSEEFALLLTGDGGWAGLDQELAARLAASGVPTVGFNSLKYFWTRRSPEQAATDVARVMRYYLSSWDKKRVLLVGYSFGADVLPFVVNRLPAELRAQLTSVSLLGLDSNASFEISVADWIGKDDSGPPTRPELAQLGALPVLCIYGEGEKDSICPGLSAPRLSSQQVGTGHHFGGEYSQLADRILAFARGARPVT
ncbi:MAG TPA: AcvB/VirJ family lysyl-phosphatidylglycerol hydrolase [Steroidobacteraceae bacterium]|nr:AcvB/VirJ family lysyl-phosphatidylglycerol hydrolase [Steroidobacteraceae bacterium]